MKLLLLNSDERPPGQLVHFRHAAMYSLDPDRFEPVSLFIKHWEDITVLNKLFFYILTQAVSWQGMWSYLPSTTADVEALGASEYQAITPSKNGQQTFSPHHTSPRLLQSTFQPWQQWCPTTRRLTLGTSWSSASIKRSTTKNFGCAWRASSR